MASLYEERTSKSAGYGEYRDSWSDLQRKNSALDKYPQKLLY